VVDTCGVHSVRQEGVNFAGGVLSVISFGVGKHLRGINEKTCGDSNWYTPGNVAGLTIIAGGGAVVEAPAAGGSGSQAVVGLTGLGTGGGEGAINAVASASSTGAIFDFGIGQVNYFIFEGEKPSTCTNMNALLALAYGPSLFLDDVAQLFANMFALSSSAALNADCDDAYE